ncbi:hypothetical protein GEMRC1_001378 [Eukaryota sp. GEM-RC1]
MSIYTVDSTSSLSLCKASSSSDSTSPKSLSSIKLSWFSSGSNSASQLSMSNFLTFFFLLDAMQNDPLSSYVVYQEHCLDRGQSHNPILSLLPILIYQALSE